MLRRYRPAPFPAPWEGRHDPRSELAEVVGEGGSGGLELRTAQGQHLVVPAAQVQPGVECTPGTRVTLLGGDTWQVVPLRADPQELAWSHTWLASLHGAGLQVEANLESLLCERLRRVPFGAVAPTPLRRFLRALLEQAVGRFPQQDFGRSLEEEQALLARRLERLGVSGLSVGRLPMWGDPWELLEILAQRANATLARARSALRLVACEREPLLPTEGPSEDVDPLNDHPVWLLLLPSTARRLEAAQVLRTHRDEPASALSAAVGDSRRLLLGAAEPEPRGATIIRLPTRPAAAAPAGERRVAEEPAAEGPVAVQAGPRSLSPEEEKVRREREEALLREFGLPVQGSCRCEHLVALAPERRQALAYALVELARSSHLADGLFEELVLLAPECFHPWLGELDPVHEPQSLAWVGAPEESTAFALPLLEHSSALSLREHVGGLGRSRELRRLERQPANELAMALLVLARSGAPRALEGLERWLGRTATPAAEVVGLLGLAGWAVHEGRLVRVWQQQAWRVVGDAQGEGVRFGAARAPCAVCGRLLLRLLELPQGTAEPLLLYTCASCVAGGEGLYHVRLSPRGPYTLRVARPHAAPQLHLPRWEVLAAAPVRLEPAPAAMPAHLEAAELLTRVGGAPSWLQSPATRLRCPLCHQPLRFAAQFAEPPGQRWSPHGPGLLYAFHCPGCRVVSTLVQHA